MLLIGKNDEMDITPNLLKSLSNRPENSLQSNSSFLHTENDMQDEEEIIEVVDHDPLTDLISSRIKLQTDSLKRDRQDIYAAYVAKRSQKKQATVADTGSNDLENMDSSNSMRKLLGELGTVSPSILTSDGSFQDKSSARSLEKPSSSQLTEMRPPVNLPQATIPARQPTSLRLPRNLPDKVYFDELQVRLGRGLMCDVNVIFIC